MEENLEGQIALAWSPPVYDTGRVPHQLLSAQFPENTSGEPDAHNHTIFARFAKWCPDGSAALAQCEDKTFRFLQLPPELLGITADASKHAALPASIMQPSPILDFAWYPSATIHDPASFCFVASVRECPVKLLDASDGRLRASYRIVDHRERQIAPHSLAFNVAASRLYCGFEDAIEVFDVHRPGEGTRLHITPSKKSRDGLKGIVSALAFAPDVSSDLYAAGTLNPSAPTSSNIALFQEAAGEAPVMLVGAEDTHPAPGTGYGVRASVSQLAFNPARPYLLYASFRRTDTIYAWDLRGDVTRPVALYDKSAAPKGSAPAAKTKAKTQTNQRLRFDIDLGGTRLAVGDERGCISVFDLTEPETAADAGARTPALQFHAHGDAVGSVAFHPLHPLALSVAGSRHFGGAAAAVREGDSDSSEDSDEDSDEDDGPDGDRMGEGEGLAGSGTVSTATREMGQVGSPEGGQGVGVGARIVRLPRRRRGPVALDASVKLWRFAHD